MPASGVTLTAPATGSSPYSVYYDSAFVLRFTVSDMASYFPQVVLGSSGAPFTPPLDGGEYVVTLHSVKSDTSITVTLAAKKTVTLTADAGITITSPAGGSGAYEAPQGGTFSYAFTVNVGYENPTVNGEPTAAGIHSFTLNNDTTLNFTTSIKKWRVKLNTDGTLTGITLEANSAYPAGGYELEHGQSLTVDFTVDANKYPALSPPKGVTYILTKAGNVYSLQFPSVTDNIDFGLATQDGLTLSKGVVPVKEDISSRGAGTELGTKDHLYVLNKGPNSGNSYSTHLKFDFSSLPLSTLAQFPSVQLKLTTGWQSDDTKGAQWLVTETADNWTEATPFLQSASPAPVDTIGMFTFEDIHPTTPAQNVGIYIDLTNFLVKWFSAPERSTDKILSLRIHNTLQTSGGGEVGLKSKENTGGDLGPKLIFGSVNTDLSSLTVGGNEVFEAGRDSYFLSATSDMIGAKMPAVSYTLAGDPSLVKASPVAYLPADSTFAAGKHNAITFTVAPVAELEGEGAVRRYAMTYRFPLVIEANETKTSVDYTSGGYYSDVVFRVTDSSAAQLIVSSPLTVQGVVKVVRPFEANRFYAVGFPFDATPSAAPSELLAYDGRQLVPAATIEAGKGYLIKFAAADEVTFTSASNPVLSSGVTTIFVNNSDSSFIANPYVNNVMYVQSIGGAYYRYNSEGHYFERVATPNSHTNPVKPFDGIIVSTNKTADFISLGAGSRLPHRVTFTAGGGISIASGTAMVRHDSAFVLTFTVDGCYENPVVTIANNAGYTLGAPNANGVYTVRIDAVTTDTTIEISAMRKQFGLTLTASGVTVTNGAADVAVPCGSLVAVEFTVNNVYESPEVTVNGAPYTTLAWRNDTGIVEVSVSEATAISITVSTKRFGITITSDGNVTASKATDEVTYGSEFTFTFTLNQHYANPQVTINGDVYPLAAPVEGVYTVTTTITAITAINLSASLETFEVAVSAVHATVTSPGGASMYVVAYGGTFTLTFTVDEFCRNPQVSINGEPYTLASPVNDVYTVTSTITAAMSISITASPEEYDLTLTAGSHITLVSPAAAGAVTVAYGEAFSVSFRVDAGYTPMLKADGAEVQIGEPNAEGVYTVTAIPSVSGEHLVTITATGATSVYREDPSDPVVRTHYYTIIGQEVSEPATTNFLIVKRIHASGKVTVRKELRVKN
jgi:hypothetical protein